MIRTESGKEYEIIGQFIRSQSTTVPFNKVAITGRIDHFSGSMLAIKPPIMLASMEIDGITENAAMSLNEYNLLAINARASRMVGQVFKQTRPLNRVANFVSRNVGCSSCAGRFKK